MLSRKMYRYLAGLPLLAALAAGGYCAMRLAWADYLFHLDTETDVAQAARMAPGNAEYHARLAALRENADRDARSVESELQDAVAANPRLASAWIALGLRAEAAADLPRAENCLARAVQADRTYATLWTAANYYFRHNQPARFWPVARRALRIGDVAAHDPVPLFRLFWKITEDPAAILNRGVPDVGAVQARYLEFLMRENHAPAAEPVIERVVAFAGDTDLESIFSYCDRLIAAGDGDRAIHAWNALCWRTLRQPLAPQRGISLTNGGFVSAPVEHGFDWRLPAAEGVSIERGGLPPRLWITLDGREPEVCDLVTQFVPLEPSRKYRLGFRYQTDGIANQSGLRWRITDAATGVEIPSDSDDLSSEQETERAIRFIAPAGVPLARLALVYRRAPGTVRIEGRVALGAVSLGFEP